MSFLTFLILYLIEFSSSFDIISFPPKAQILEVGDSLTLLCKSDKSWEYCDWKHEEPVSGQSRHCSFEWKSATGNVEIQQCNKELKSRIKKTGNYQNHECGLTVSSLTLEDGGIWECEMEEYLWGDWRSGTRHVKSFNLVMTKRPVVTTTVTTTSTTTSLKITSTESHDLQIVTTVRPDTTEYVNKSDDEIVTEEGEVVEEKESVTKLSIEDIDIINTTFSNDSSKFDIDFTLAREAAGINQTGGHDQMTEGTVAGIVVAVVALIIGVTIGALIFWKKRRPLEVISLRKIKETGKGGETYAFLEEAEYSMSEGFTNLTPPPK